MNEAQEYARIPIGGCMSFWSLLPKTNLCLLAEGLAEQGLQRFTPNEPSKEAALRAALDEIFTAPKGYKYRIEDQPCENGCKGFAVVSRDKSESRRPGDDWGKVVAAAWLDEGGLLGIDPYDYAVRHSLLDFMQEHVKWVGPAAVAMMLTQIIERLGGVTMRDSGGVYFLRKEVLPQWDQVRQLVRKAGAPGSKVNKVYAPHIVADQEMLEAVGDALTEEVEAEVQGIKDELASGELSTRICTNRVQRAEQIEDKVKRYEQTFNRPLARLRALAQSAQMNAAKAALAAAASKFATSTP